LSEPHVADALAEAAIAGIESNMIVGFGAGRTTARAVSLLADRVKQGVVEGIRIATVTDRSEELCRSMGLEIIDFTTLSEIDLLIDGADAVDHQLRMLKGAGGSMTRERIIAWSAHKRRYIIPEQKLVDTLGDGAALPVAVMYFGLASTRAALHALGVNGVVRVGMDGDPVVTENGNLMLDATIDAEHQDLEELAAALNDVPGVVDHGLFLYEADEVLVDQHGEVHQLIRPDDDDM
jgi:ribose 5-phosphate isomerase A